MKESELAITIPPPDGGVVRSIEVPVLRSTLWKDGVLNGAPETRPDSPVWTVGRQFPIRAEDVLSSQRLILMWPGEGNHPSPHAAGIWGRTHGLRETHPLEVFDLSAAFHCLYQQFGLEGAGLVSTRARNLGGKLQVCCVWQSSPNLKGRWAALSFAGEELAPKRIFVFGEPIAPAS
jgi:hypothetical protein